LATYFGLVNAPNLGWHCRWGFICFTLMFYLNCPSQRFTCYMGMSSTVGGLLEGPRSQQVSAIVFQAAYRIGLKTLKNWVLILIALLSFGLIQFTYSTPFPMILLLAATVGVVGGRLYPSYFFHHFARKE
jgi:chromate transporter